MNRLPIERRAAVLRCLNEGNSVRATSRLTSTSKTTILKLVCEFGEFASWFQDGQLVNLPCKDIQIDEIWSFCGCKEKNKPKSGGKLAGSVWTWVAVCRDTKLVPSWLVADRNNRSAVELMIDLSHRLSGRAQISTDGFKSYLMAVKRAFPHGDVDFGRVVKIYGNAKHFNNVIGMRKEVITGSPNISHICTSHIERQNLNMRMSMRRFTRKTNGFSKKVENHAAMLAVHYLNYNFIRKHQTIKAAPAVEAGVCDESYKLESLIEMFDEYRNEKYPCDRPARYKRRAAS